MAKEKTSPQRQLPFHGWESIRAATLKRRNELVDGVELSPTLKRMLKLLHSYCVRNGKRWCWPSMRTLAEDLGYPTISADEWKLSKRTMIRQLGQLEKLKLLRKEHQFRTFKGSDSGQTSNVYAIRYRNLGPRVATTVNRRERHRGVSLMTPGGVTNDTGGCHVRHRGVSLMTPHELNGMELNPNLIPTEPERVGSGGGNVVWHTGLTRDSLKDPEARQRLWLAAVGAGVLQDDKLDRMRFKIACHRARSDDSLTNCVRWLITTIERRRWDLLSDESIAFALRNTPGVTFSAEEIEEIKCSSANVKN